MGFVESLKGLIYDILHNLDRINVDYITSNGLNPLRIRHDSGGLIEFKSDGKAYYNGVEIGSGSVTDHGSLLGLSDYDHDQYLRKNGSQYMTDDLYINCATPHVVLQESGALRGSIYIESDDSFVIDAASQDLTLVSAADDINVFPSGVLQAKFTPTEFISYQDVICDASVNPGFALYESADYRGGIYTNSNDDTIVDCEHGKIILGTYAGTGGVIDIQPKAGGSVATFDSAAIDFTQPLDMNGDAITNASIAGTNSAVFIVDQNNAGAEVAMALNFNRGSTAADARLLWSASTTKFVFESVLGTTYADLKAASLELTDAPSAATDAATKGYVDGARTNTGAQVAADHGTAATDQIINVCYGTSATPPTASTTTEGALYIQYTA